MQNLIDIYFEKIKLVLQEQLDKKDRYTYVPSHRLFSRIYYLYGSDFRNREVFELALHTLKGRGIVRIEKKSGEKHVYLN